MGAAAVCMLLSTLASAASDTLTATVIQADPEARTLTLNPLGDVPDGLGSPVTVTVGRGDATLWEPGDALRGRLLKSAGAWRLESIWPADPQKEAHFKGYAWRLRRDTMERGREAFRGLGEALPKFALWDQHGELARSEDWRGKAVVINFVFTRCTVPTMCPASTSRMAELQDRAAATGLDNLLLVSVSLDPEYDSPGIFTAYASDYGIDSSNFLLLSGSTEVLEDLKKQFAVLSRPDENQIISHTLMTTLVAPDGTIAYQVPGSFWEVDDFLARAQALLADPTPES